MDAIDGSTQNRSNRTAFGSSYHINMANIDIKSLRDLQASINAHIDSLVSTLEQKEDEHHPKNKDAQSRLHSTASTLAHITADPAEQVFLMCFQVSVIEEVLTQVDNFFSSQRQTWPSGLHTILICSP